LWDKITHLKSNTGQGRTRPTVTAIRGAAGAAILNAELLQAQGYLKRDR